MRRTLSSLLACAALALFMAACRGTGLTQAQVVDRAWAALEPNTSSHERANWETASVEQVQGSAVAELYEGRVAPGCPGPEPPANGRIDPDAAYWHVVLRPLPATESGERLSPTAPPRIPEAFLREARILLDADGRVVARRLLCVIY